jgi:hypothetical protein
MWFKEMFTYYTKSSHDLKRERRKPEKEKIEKRKGKKNSPCAVDIINGGPWKGMSLSPPPILLRVVYYFAFPVLPLSPQLALLASVGGERGPMPIPLRGI